jgi:hypothetical protein
MSQRLYIGSNPPEKIYDCVIDSTENVGEKLLSEYFCLSKDTFIGPWKIRIADLGLYRLIEPDVRAAFELLGKSYPSDVWVFYMNGHSIDHPTTIELDSFLNGEGMG